MAGRRRSEPEDESTRRRPPATTPEDRENQLIVLASDLAERQLRAGTASSQVITHYLKLGSTREKLEQNRLAMEVELMEAKKENLATVARIEDLYIDAIRAMKSYSGQDPVDFEGADYDHPDVF